MKTLWPTLLLSILFTGVADTPVSASKGQVYSKSKKIPKRPKSKNAELETNLKTFATDIKGTSGRWSFAFQGLEMLILTDERADRMRIISPVIESKKLDKEGLEALLSANFNRALDAKYSINEGVVWSTFTHPLRDLTMKEFRSAAKQVASLVRNYGTSYSSLDVVFGGGAQ